MAWGLKVHIIILIITTNLLHVTSDTVNFYSPTHTVRAIGGGDISLEVYRGKVSLVVNVASACGFTDKHYKGLVRLQSILGKTGKFIVLAFPCNQFAGQEPDPESNILKFVQCFQPEADILKFVQEKYQVNFAVFGKINVLEKDVPEAWNYIIRESGNAPNWNFWKYLVDHKGKVIGSWGPWSDVEEIFPAVKTAVDAAVEEAVSMTTPSPAPLSDTKVDTDVHNEGPSIHEDL